MAGHSKWKNIQHRKGRQDAIRAKIFTKISKEIFVAVRNGGPDPNTNMRLKVALQKAKDNNVPNENVERTIKKATGDLEGITYEEITYEGYGPGGVAVMVEVLTDNRNRSAAEVRHIFSKNGGNMGESGCVSFLFNRKGQITINKQEYTLDEDEVMMVALEAGAEDIETTEESITILTSPDELEVVRESLVSAGIPIASSEVTMVPTTTVKITGDDAVKMLKLMDMMEESDDIQNVYANFEIDDEEMEKIG
jgi:YebC/PmpR family DNA-binding regulatory protein